MLGEPGVGEWWTHEGEGRWAVRLNKHHQITPEGLLGAIHKIPYHVRQQWQWFSWDGVEVRDGERWAFVKARVNHTKEATKKK